MFARLANVFAGGIDFAISEKSYDAADSRKRALSAAVWKRMTRGARDSLSGVNDKCFVRCHGRRQKRIPRRLDH